MRLHPLVDLELTVEISATLYQMMDAGEIDLVLCKRRAGDDRGRLVWRDHLVWIGTEATRIDPAQPLPLILYTPPSITRTAALETLERDWPPLAHRLLQRQPQRSPCRRPGWARRHSARARSDAGWAGGDASRHIGCPISAT